MSTIYLTANGEAYDPRLQYFFWHGNAVRSTDDFYRRGGFIVDQMDAVVVPVGELHRTRDAAIEHGQKAILREIDALKSRIESLENEKSPERRTLKYRLQARQH